MACCCPHTRVGADAPVSCVIPFPEQQRQRAHELRGWLPFLRSHLPSALGLCEPVGSGKGRAASFCGFAGGTRWLCGSPLTGHWTTQRQMVCLYPALSSFVQLELCWESEQRQMRVQEPVSRSGLLRWKIGHLISQMKGRVVFTALHALALRSSC